MNKYNFKSVVRLITWILLSRFPWRLSPFLLFLSLINRRNMEEYTSLTSPTTPVSPLSNASPGSNEAHPSLSGKVCGVCGDKVR